MRLTPVGKIVLLLLVVGAAVGVGRVMLVPPTSGPGITVPNTKPLPAPIGTNPDDSKVTAAAMPGSETGCSDKPEVRYLGYAWNSQMGLMFANGGVQATKGSLMCQHGVNFHFERQDDNGKLQEALVSFATELSQGVAQPKKGAHFVAIMGDGSAAFLKGLNDTLKRLGPEYTAKIVGSCGYSLGEDKFMGPPAWKTNPAASRGGLCAGVLRDGDWNIAQKWLGDNGLKTNPDEKTWDPDALNWVNANDYIDAAQKYVAGYSEERPVVHNGKRTGQKKRVSVDSVVTWTPGDVTVKEKGGLVSIVSTREYASQMPNVIIGIDKWMKQNRSTVEGMLAAIGEGGAQVKHFPSALKRAAEISAVAYKDKDAAYWERYFTATEETDKQGLQVELGGSSVNTLSDQLSTFGLVAGNANIFASTYTVFGDLVVSQYPKLVPSYYPVNAILDTSYLQALAKQTPTQASPSKPIYRPGPVVAVSRKNWNIQFETGRAAFSPAASKQLQLLYNGLVVASGTLVEIHGHTDNQGNADANRALSEARAFAVKAWLQKKSPRNFPDSRFRIHAHGQEQPLVPNATPEGRARNRRVEIVLGTTAQPAAK